MEKTTNGKQVFIINQDRDMIYPSTGELYSNVIEHDGTFYGINLCQYGIDKQEQFLGTFDTTDEAIAEINAIVNTDLEFYPVSGYSDYDCLDELTGYADSLTEVEYNELAGK